MTFGARSSDESKPKQFLWAHEDAMISFVGRMEDHGNCLFYLVLFSYSLENNKKIFQGIYHIQILSNPQGQIIPMIRKGNTTFLKVTMALLNKCPRHYIDIGGDKPRLTGRNIENFALKITEPEVRAAQDNLEDQWVRERGLHRKKREKPAATCSR